MSHMRIFVVVNRCWWPCPPGAAKPVALGHHWWVHLPGTVHYIPFFFLMCPHLTRIFHNKETNMSKNQWSVGWINLQGVLDVGGGGGDDEHDFHFSMVIFQCLLIWPMWLTLAIWLLSNSLLKVCLNAVNTDMGIILFPLQFQSFSQYRCKTAKKSEEEIEFLRNNPKIWNVHSVLNVLHSLVDKSNINRQLEVYTSGGTEECLKYREP